MRKISSKKLKNVHNILSSYSKESSSVVYDIPSLMKYCIENGIKTLVKDEIKRIDDEHINSIFSSLNFNIKLHQLKTKKNSVKIEISFNSNFEEFNSNYRAS